MIYLTTLLTILIVFISGWMDASASYASVYHIKNNGNDNASGLSENEAWETIAKVNDFAENPGFSNGDVILFRRGDTWGADESLGYDGTAINWGEINGLKIGAFGSGARPRFDANKLKRHCILIDGNSGALKNLTIESIDVSGMDGMGGKKHVYIHEVDGVRIRDLYCDGQKGASTYARPSVVLNIRECDGDITVEDCELFNIYNPINWDAWGKKDAGLIGLSYTHSLEPTLCKTSGKIVIRNNKLHHVYSDCIITGDIRSPDGYHIYGNTMSHWGENAIDNKGCRYQYIYNNKMSGEWQKIGGTGGLPSPIVLHDSDSDGYYDAEDIFIYENYFLNAPWSGISCLDTRRAYIYDNYFKSVGCSVYVSWMQVGEIKNNIIIADKKPLDDEEAIRVAGSKNNSGIKVANNSIYISHRDYKRGVRWQAITGQTNNYVQNNAVMIETGMAEYPLYLEDRDGSGSLPKVSRNIWYNADHANRVYWNGKVYRAEDQISWQNAGHTGGLFLNPNFNNPQAGDLKLSSSSPCLECGALTNSIESPPDSNSPGLSPPNNLKIKRR